MRDPVRYFTLPALFVLLASPAFEAGAQRSEPDVIPRELAVALLGAWSFDGGASTLVTGRAPERFSAIALPSGWEILGGISSDMGRQMVLRAPAAPDEALTVLERTLRSGGWNEAPQQQAPPRGGFVSARATPTRESRHFCRENRFLAIRMHPRAAGGSLASLREVSAGRGSPCEEPPGGAPRSRPRGDPFGTSPIPALVPPDGAKVTSSSGAIGGESTESRALIETQSSASALLAHYGRQLTEAGWRSTGRVHEGGTGIERWQVTDEDGVAWFGALTIIAHPDGRQYYLAVHLRREDAERPF